MTSQQFPSPPDLLADPPHGTQPAAVRAVGSVRQAGGHLLRGYRGEVREDSAGGWLHFLYPHR